MSYFSGCHAEFRQLPKCRIGKMSHASHPLSIWMKKYSNVVWNIERIFQLHKMCSKSLRKHILNVIQNAFKMSGPQHLRNIGLEWRCTSFWRNIIWSYFDLTGMFHAHTWYSILNKAESEGQTDLAPWQEDSSIARRRKWSLSELWIHPQVLCNSERLERDSAETLPLGLYKSLASPLMRHSNSSNHLQIIRVWWPSQCRVELVI
jgi:hypothetical protein